MNHEYHILPTISCVFYFFGILCLYIKKWLNKYIINLMSDKRDEYTYMARLAE